MTDGAYPPLDVALPEAYDVSLATHMLHEAGHVIDGKYRLVRLLGTGGMGAVYEGENLLIRRRVAIKILHVAASGNSDSLRRFEREAQAAGQIGNDHILEVLDIGSLPNGDRYLVMEYLDGETLAARIERHGQLTPAQIAPIARQFLTALVSAHAAGVIHRDLKPDNIFILRAKAGRVDFVKLIDFGISKFSRPFDEGEQRMTRADAVLGTPVYMSPEQARGARQTDVRSDIYSCGVILYEAVTGRVPFEGESFNDLMFKIALSDAPSPETFVPSLDRDFAAIINRAIARDPNDRFASAQEFATALDEWMVKNSITESLALQLPSDAFPTRPRPSDATELPTLSPEEGELLRGKKIGVEESWSHSNGSTTEPSRHKGLPRLAAFSVGGLATIGLILAFMVRADPVPIAVRDGVGNAAAASATAIGMALIAHELPTALSAAAPEPTIAGVKGDSVPTGTQAAATPGDAAAQGIAATFPIGADTAAKAIMAHASPSSPAAAPPERPKPKAATAVSAKGFDFGY